MSKYNILFSEKQIEFSELLCSIEISCIVVHLCLYLKKS